MSKNPKEETLDPEDWDRLRALGHRMMDDMMTSLETLRERKGTPIPEETIAKIQQPLPLEPQGEEQVYSEFVENVLPYPIWNIHPRWFGWVQGTGSPFGMLAEMLAAGINNASTNPLSSSIYIENQVIDWLKEMLGYPPEASGIIVSGGTMANITGLAVARNTMAKMDLKKQGLQEYQPRMKLYTSKEGHMSLKKGVELLGLGSKSIRWIPVDNGYQIDVKALESEIKRDKRAGYHPFCVIGTAGTVNTGAFDDFNALADICEREGMWFHVDGAFGAWAKLSSTHDRLVSGMERADSLAFDLHKWMYMPYEIGCTLVRDKEAHYRTFSFEAEYLTVVESTDPTNYGVQLSRSFRALKAWMLLKAYGVEKYGRLIQQNIDQATYLAGLVEEAPELELLAPVSLNIVCFRFSTDEYDEETLNELNREILPQLWFGSQIIPSDTTLNGRYSLRVCITNHRTRREDLSYLVDEVIRIGKELTKTK